MSIEPFKPLLWVVILCAFILALPRTCHSIELNTHTITNYLETKYELPSNLLNKICSVESRYKNVVGQHGEIGVCQLKPSTVRHAFGIKSALYPHLPYLSFGSTGQAVHTLQNSLTILGYAVQKSGVFDKSTGIALRHYQGTVHLNIDGIVGPRTWSALLGPISIEEQLWNPRTNMEYAAKYLQWLSRVLKTNNPHILAAAYNGGPGNPIVRYMILVDNREVTE